MTIKVGFLKSETQTIIKKIDLSKKVVESYIITSQEIKKEPLHLLFFESESSGEQLAHYISDEEKFYPILEISSVGMTLEQFENSNYDQILDIFTKINTRWILSRNIQTVEKIYPTINYMRDLWVSDRNSFFEELWFILKTNLGTQNLNIVFNDLKMPSDKQKEKGEKPKLCHSFVKGEKVPQIFEGTDAEEKLMKEYKNEFADIFNITEYNADSGQLVFCANIDKSPVLIMAQLPSLNQLQRSLLISLFTGLQ